MKYLAKADQAQTLPSDPHHAIRQLPRLLRRGRRYRRRLVTAHGLLTRHRVLQELLLGRDQLVAHIRG